jgi:hypothetical protein
MGSLFIIVVVAFPNGLAGIYRDYLDPYVDRLLGTGKALRRITPTPDEAAAAATQASAPR